MPSRRSRSSGGYRSTSGFDFAHVFVPEERIWLRAAAESGRFLPVMDRERAEALLERLTEVEVFEQFVHRVFPGRTRFSLEGLDMLVPMLDEIISGAGDRGVRHTMLGMAHRGRLNVLAHVLDKPRGDSGGIQGPRPARSTARSRLARRREVSRGRADVEPARPDVPDVGAQPKSSRSRQSGGRGHGARRRNTGEPSGAPDFDSSVELPLLIHGDAFPAQGLSLRR